MYPAPEGANYKKNNHASAWHMNLENDLRCLMSVEPTADYYETIHHELGHIYYYQAYTNPDVPPLLRGGANRGYHEAIGSLLGLAAMQKPFLASKGLVDENAKVDETQKLLKERLQNIGDSILAGGVDNMEKYRYAVGQAHAIQLTLQDISNLLKPKEQKDEQGNVIDIGEGKGSTKN